VRSIVALLTIVLAACTAGFALASPEGAPWGAADPDAAENCSTCHFDDEPVRDSEALSIEGLPPEPVPGKTYELTIRFRDPDAVVAGYQMIATASDQPAGQFHSATGNVEFVGAAIRSTVPARIDGGVTWSLTWTAPNLAAPKLIFHLAVAGSNDDASPLGDRIHYRSFALTPYPRSSCSRHEAESRAPRSARCHIGIGTRCR
jgi:hypothetical protein